MGKGGMLEQMLITIVGGERRIGIEEGLIVEERLQSSALLVLVNFVFGVLAYEDGQFM